MVDDSKYDAFLRQNDPRAPRGPAREWDRIRAKIDSTDEPWMRIVRDSIRSLDFWIPSMSLSALALIGVAIFSHFDNAPSTTDTVTRITELYQTDLVSSTAYDFKAFN